MKGRLPGLRSGNPNTVVPSYFSIGLVTDRILDSRAFDLYMSSGSNA
ncbi:hypothetical protein SAMN05421797_10725 [Maribacter ulvicola]|uniref:Uncharacterized protein n=1 Tax=Maribacter ulvicola TaxID=228959 RepID=A0A1N6YK01_9FLAO|nr:hypothetical protein SAMN05421797_10725 [Maribacter ulvicola]